MVYVALSSRLLKMCYSSPQADLLSVLSNAISTSLGTSLQLLLEANLFMCFNTNVVKYSCELKELE